MPRAAICLLITAILAITQSPIQSAILNPHSTMSPSPSGWRPLFDGKSLAGWKGYQADAVPAGWRVANGTLTKDGRVADIVSTD